MERFANSEEGNFEAAVLILRRWVILRQGRQAPERNPLVDNALQFSRVLALDRIPLESAASR